MKCNTALKYLTYNKMVPHIKYLFLLLCCSLHGKNINILSGLFEFPLIVSSQNIRNSELFRRLNIKRAKESEIDSITNNAKIQTEDIVDCGVSCSKEETCSGLQYSSETKVCRRMKKVKYFKLEPNQHHNIPVAALYPVRPAGN